MVTEAQSRTGVVEGRAVNLVRIAKAQRKMLLLVPLMLGLVPVLMAGQWPIERLAGPQVGGGFIVGLVFMLWVAAMATTLRLLAAEGHPPLMVVVTGLVCLLPPVLLVVMLALNRDATVALKGAGAPVGLFGVAPRDLPRLTVKACPSCGYDLHGLRGDRCPECGRAAGLARA